MPKQANCFACVQDLKGAAMFLFERAQAAKGKNREPGLQENSVRNFTGRQVRVHQLLYARQDLKAAALCEFEFTQSVDERRAWRGGVASAARQ